MEKGYMSDQYLSGGFPTAGARINPRRNETRATCVYLIKRSDGVIKVGVSKNVNSRKSHLAHASPDKLSILKVIRPGKGLAFHIETGVKILLRPFREVAALLAPRMTFSKLQDVVADIAVKVPERVVMKDLAIQDKRHIALCSAFNNCVPSDGGRWIY
jgi:hypothetical protein